MLITCNKFCVDNDNNRINEWSSGLFIKIIQGELTQVLQADARKEIEVQKEIEALKFQLHGDSENPPVVDNQPKKQVASDISEETQKKVIDLAKKKKENKKSNGK